MQYLMGGMLLFTSIFLIYCWRVSRSIQQAIPNLEKYREKYRQKLNKNAR